MFLFTDNGLIKAEEITGTAAFLSGLGVYEIIRVYTDGKGCTGVEYLTDHYQRLRSSAEKMGLHHHLTFENLAQAVYEVLKMSNANSGAVRIIIAASEYPECKVLIGWENKVYTAEQKKQGFKIVVARRRISSFSPTAQMNTLSNADNMLELLQARAGGYDECIRLNTDGYVAEGCISNVFWQSGRVLFTPSLETGILPGIMRKYVLEKYRAEGCLVREGMYEVNDLYGADRIFLTNSIMQEMPAYFLNN